jgi:hypothetical protein
MVRIKAKYSCRAKEIIRLAGELRVKLHEIDQKLEHLIRSQRHFYSLHYKERELDD